MPFKKGETPKGAKIFKEGQSGNPEGRPKGSVSRSTIARKILSMVGYIPDAIFEELKLLYPTIEKKMSFEEIMTLVQAKKAIVDGDNQSYKLVLDSAFGAPKQEMDMVGEIKITDHKLTIEVIAPKEDED